jgi:nucleotide-binding universal stress UspA family protein
MMYKKVVVPLDGSKLAEVALPHLEEVAKGCNIADVLLITVTEKIKGMVPQDKAFGEEFVPEQPVGVPPPQFTVVQPGIVYGNMDAGVQKIPLTMGKMAKTADKYLIRVAEDLDKKGFNVTATVLVGNPAEEILNYADEQSADLIIMASRGKSGFSRWDIGNIAEKVIRATNVPVMLIKPAKDFKETKKKRKGLAL